MARVSCRLLLTVFLLCFVVLEYYRLANLMSNKWKGTRKGSHTEITVRHHQTVPPYPTRAVNRDTRTRAPETTAQHASHHNTRNTPQQPRFKTPPPTSGKKHPNFPNGASVPVPYPVFPHRFTDRQKRVVAALMHGWDNYVKYAWGHDELLVDVGVSDWGERSTSSAGIGLTAIETVPTLWIMGKEDEVQKVANYLQNNHTFNKDLDISLFETTIRCLGGLLSGYELTGIPVFLDKANDLGNRLMNAFRRTNNKVPYTTINLKTGNTKNAGFLNSRQLLAEITTIQVEFKKLSYFTGDMQYDDAAQGVMQAVLSYLPSMEPKLFSTFVDLQSGKPLKGVATLGAKGDSFYEYLVKQWVLTNRTEKWLEEAWDGVGDAIHKHMLVQIDDTRAFLAEVSLGGNNEQIFKMDHLVCFTPGMYLLGLHGTAQKQARDKKLAADVARTCYNMYAMNPTGIGSEIVKFRKKELNYKMYVTAGDEYYILRPEAIESQFYLYRFTRDKEWVENGWKMFEAIEKYCKVRKGWKGIGDVTQLRSWPRSKMESFFLAETLKYSFLLQADPDVPDCLPLDEWIFNTEAHPMRIMDHPLRK